MLELEDMEKVHVEGNEFRKKHLLAKQKPEKKFLLYFTGPKPTNEENWLLDQELSQNVFHTDQEALFIQETRLGFHLKDLISNHLEFLKAKKRHQKLKNLLNNDDEHQQIKFNAPRALGQNSKL